MEAINKCKPQSESCHFHLFEVQYINEIEYLYLATWILNQKTPMNESKKKKYTILSKINLYVKHSISRKGGMSRAFAICCKQL